MEKKRVFPLWKTSSMRRSRSLVERERAIQLINDDSVSRMALNELKKTFYAGTLKVFARKTFIGDDFDEV
jgi:hypothetical protein